MKSGDINSGGHNVQGLHRTGQSGQKHVRPETIQEQEVGASTADLNSVNFKAGGVGQQHHSTRMSAAAETAETVGSVGQPAVRAQRQTETSPLAQVARLGVMAEIAEVSPVGQVGQPPVVNLGVLNTSNMPTDTAEWYVHGRPFGT